VKANGAQGYRFPGVITSGYLPNNGLHLTRLSGRLAKVAGPASRPVIGGVSPEPPRR
jgi:hypothetical protein